MNTLTTKKIRRAFEEIGCTNWRNHSNVFVQIKNGDISGAIGTLYAGSSNEVFSQKRKDLKKALSF